MAFYQVMKTLSLFIVRDIDVIARIIFVEIYTDKRLLDRKAKEAAARGVL